MHELDRLAHTSSIAALHSISSAHGASKINVTQKADREKREGRLRKVGQRQLEHQLSVRGLRAHALPTLAS